MGLKKLKDIVKSIGVPNKDDTLLGIFNGKTGQKSIEDIVKAVEFTNITNNPVTLITTEEFDGSKLADGAYIVARKNGSQVFVTSENGIKLGSGATLSFGTKISIDDGTAVIINGTGTFVIWDTSTIDNWNLDDYCPSLSEVESMISLIDMTDIEISQALVKFKSIDNNNLSLTMKEFAEAMMQYFQSYDEQISAKQDKIVLGDGLKWVNGKLCLDIKNGDNLKYGTSTQSEETNENEVVSNERFSVFQKE